MSSEDDLERARELLILALDVDAATASRIANIVGLMYVQRARAASRDVVLHAAAWAAQRLNALPADELARVSPPRIAALLQRSDCPLCLGGSDDDNRGGSTPVTTPVGGRSYVGEIA